MSYMVPIKKLKNYFNMSRVFILNFVHDTICTMPHYHTLSNLFFFTAKFVINLLLPYKVLITSNTLIVLHAVPFFQSLFPSTRL